MALDTYLVATDILSRVAMSAQKTYVKTQLPKVGWQSLPLQELLESVKEGHDISGEDGAINDGMQLVPQLLSQFIRGEDTIMSPQDVNDSLRFESIYTWHVMPIKFKHDEWRQRGWELTPHAHGDIQDRIKKMGNDRLQKLHDDLLRYTMEGVNRRFSELQELANWKQGASYKEPVGMNGQFPIVPTGSLYGHNRLVVPQMRHITKGSTSGSGGTMIADLRDLFRQLNEASVNCGIAGEWVIIAGKLWIDAYASECERLGIQRQGNVGGVGNVDYIIKDDQLRVGGLKPIWAPMLDRLDSLASSELGVTTSVNAVTFSGGGATTQATGMAIVSGGAVTGIIITSPGAGYTSAPTCTVATGTGATFTVKVFSTNSGAGLTTVQADDSRLGQLDTVTVSGGGSGYTNGASIPFTKRAYFVFKPAVKYKIGNKVDRRISIPADPARQRLTELQIETLAYFYNRMPSAFALHYLTN